MYEKLSSYKQPYQWPAFLTSNVLTVYFVILDVAIHGSTAFPDARVEEPHVESHNQIHGTIKCTNHVIN